MFKIVKMGKYLAKHVPDHPRATKEGMVYVHILNVEAKLGRYLLPDEIVHHLDENKYNNQEENLIVFATTADHIRFHRNGCDMSLLDQMENGSFCCKKIENESCPECGQKKEKRAQTCRECYYKNRLNNIPLKQDLVSKLFENDGNFEATGRSFGVTGNAVRKWCKRYGLEYYSNFYRN